MSARPRRSPRFQPECSGKDERRSAEGDRRRRGPASERDERPDEECEEDEDRQPARARAAHVRRISCRWCRSSSGSDSRSSASSSTCCGRSRRGSGPRRSRSSCWPASVSIARSACTRRVISEPMTKTTPETARATITASVTASTGGVSMITQSNGPDRRLASSALMRSDESSSDGFGGMRPAAMTNRFGSLVFCTASRTRACPTSRCDRPTSFCAPMTVWRPGRRMSPSTRSTRDPPSASTIPRLQAVVVLPSSGWLLVTAMTRGPPAPLVKTSDVRSDRNASPKSCGTGLGEERDALVAHRGHEAQQRQTAAAPSRRRAS